MRTSIKICLAFCVLSAGALWLLSAPHPTVALDDPYFQQAGDSKRGEHVFDAAGCASCHETPPSSPSQDPDRMKLGGGMALATAFGTFRAPNISSDKTYGIGNWSAAEIANAILSGTAQDGSHLYPVFPYATYAHMTREDVRNLIAWLRTLPPVATPSPPHDLHFPFSVRRAIGLWKLLYLREGPITEDPTRDAAWNRGRYLAEAQAHCAECHSPRGVLGGIVESEKYAGGPDPEGKGWIPNITQAPDGIAKWSASDIEGVLTDGVTPDSDDVGSSMADVVENISRLPKADVAAIAEYIKSLPAKQGPPRPKKSEDGKTS